MDISASSFRAAQIARRFIGVLSFALFTGCATNFEPKPLSPDHPASAQGEEAPRSRMHRLIATDQLTRTTQAQLARTETPNATNGPSPEATAMPGMDMNKPAAAASPAAVIYTCVMHPEVQQPVPGKCPKCGMTLVKKEPATP